MNKRILLIVLLLVGAIGAIAAVAAIVVPLSLRSSERAAQREIAEWSWGSYGIQCPPMQVKGALLTHAQRADLKRAVAWLNRAARRTLYTHTPQPNKPVVTVYGGWPKHIPDDGLCRELSPHPGRTYRQPEWDNPVTEFGIRVCFNIIHKAKQYQNAAAPNYESIRNTARLGNVGHIVHELIHPYTGDRPGHSHPKQGHGIAVGKPRFMELGPVALGILDRVDKHCSGPAGSKSGGEGGIVR